MNPVFHSADFAGLLPELAAFAGAFLVLALDMAQRHLRRGPMEEGETRAGLRAISIAALALGLFWTALGAGVGAGPQPGMVGTDSLAALGKGLLAAVGILSLMVGAPVGGRLGLEHGEFYALILFAVGGMMAFVGSENLMFTFVALETFSLSMYVLAGFNKRLASSREAALKYFLLGAYAAAFFLFGMALIYGATGSVSYAAIAETYSAAGLDSARARMLTAGVLMVAVAFAFKVGVAPFHLWVPDTYEGASTPVAAFLSAGAKAAGFVALLRLGHVLPLSQASFTLAVSVLAVLTMTLANVAALKQTSVKRLLAFSSISHSGYALLGLAGGSPEAVRAVVLYVVVYTVMNFAAFGLLIALERSQSDAAAGRSMTLNDLAGLGFARPVYSVCLAVAMFAMAGLPPTAGFIAKLAVFKSALDGGAVTAVVLAALNSVVAAGYYLRVLVILYMHPRGETPPPQLAGALAAAVGFCTLLLLIWGVAPGGLLALSAGAFVGLP